MNSTKDNPIGFFDSGIGGTSIWKEVHKLLPNENTIYLADSKNAPYGDKTKDRIIEYCLKNTEILLNQNSKIIVVACNTATTNAIKVLRDKYTIPFIGIEPAIKPASLVTKTNNIGVLATKGTIQSDLFEKTSTNIKSDIKIIEKVGYGLVDLIEKGNVESEDIDFLLKKYLNPMMKKNIDALVLGCTHYPYLIPSIRKIITNDIKIIDAGFAVARQTKKILKKFNIAQIEEKSKTTHKFFSNKDTKVLSKLLYNYSVEILSKEF